jgi:GAF domain-containing protein/anti-sigma regulatory factor (Ser/Thr protein kinase)
MYIREVRWKCSAGRKRNKVISNNEVVQILAQNTMRLRTCLQRVTGDNEGPEEGSDAWLLLDALVHNSSPMLFTRFEQSGRWLAEHGGKLDVRLQGLQQYVDALATEINDLFAHVPLSSEYERSRLLLEATSYLYHLQSAYMQSITRGYQSAMDQIAGDRDALLEQLGQRFAALQRINGVSNSTMDLDQTLSVITKVVAEELEADLCSIFFYDELQRMLTLRATNGPRPLGGLHFTLRLGEGYSGWVADQGKPLLVRDALSDPHFSTESRAYNAEYHGLISVPIIFFGSSERLIGVISVQASRIREFTSQERNFLEVVAGIVAINIENGRLYEQTDEQLRRKVHELATIHRVSSIIASTLNLDEVLQIIATQAVHLSGAERSCIFELDSDKRHLHVVAQHGLNNALVRGIHLHTGECCAGRAVETGLPSTAMDCFNEEKGCPLANDPGVTSEIHSVLCVPLQVKHHILGCICIYSSHRHLLSHDQMQLVITFANEAAIAIENARLYEEARRGLELKSALLQELHHRVKNNLATVAGILSLQRRRTKSPEVRYTLAESVNRVQGLAATHDLLAHEDVSEARVDDIARKIVGVANANMRPPETRISFVVEPCAIVIPSRAVTILALVLNEMVSNSIKYGMTGLPQGTVTIRGFEDDGIVVVQVIDPGAGTALDKLDRNEEESSEGLGLSLIKNLIGDLRGQSSLRRLEETGQTVAEVRFPLARRTHTVNKTVNDGEYEGEKV